MSKYPWEEFNGSPINEFEPLFNENDTLSLSEADIARGTYQFFALGNQMAILHSVGGIHNDLHRDNVFYDAKTGLPHMIDFGESFFLDKPDPGVMIQEFVPPFIDFERQEFISILAGYARNSYIFIDRLYQNYTDKLLHLIGGQMTGHPKPRTGYLNVQEMLETIESRLEFNDDTLQLVETNASKVAEQLDTSPEEYFVFLIGLILAGVNLSHLFTKPGSTLPKSNTGRQIFDQMSAYYSGQSIKPGIENDSDAINIGFKLLQGLQADRDDSSQNEQPDISALIRLARLIPQLKLPPVTVNRFVDSLIDVSNYLANQLDSRLSNIDSSRPPSQQLSIKFAQLSYMLLQYSLRDISSDESRCSNILNAQVDLSWHSSVLKPDRNIDSFFNEAGFIKAKCNAFMQIFVHSSEEEQPMYSYGLEPIRTYRQFLFLADEFLGQDRSQKDLNVLNQIIPMIVKSLLGSLRAYLTTSMTNVYETFLLYDKDREKLLLDEEINWVIELVKYLEKDQVDTKTGRKLLSRIKEFEK